jgi:hypothetical protein
MLLRLDNIFATRFLGESYDCVNLNAKIILCKVSMDRRCGCLDCTKLCAVTLGVCEYCLRHFILTCYRILEESPEIGRRDQKKNDGNAHAQKDSLLEIIDQATSVSLSTRDLTNQERGQLLDILLWASDLLRDGRRQTLT